MTRFKLALILSGIAFSLLNLGLPVTATARDLTEDLPRANRKTASATGDVQKLQVPEFDRQQMMSPSQPNPLLQDQSVKAKSKFYDPRIRF